MSLNIKDEEVHRMAAELAALTGQSMTAAVGEAVRDKLTRELAAKQAQKTKMIKKMDAITKRTSAMVKGRKFVEHGDFLYDERGMPK